MKRAKLVIFSAAALGSGWLGRFMDRTAGAEAGAGPGMLVWILLPFLAAVVLRLPPRGDRKGLGLGFRFRGHAADYAFSALFYPAAALVILAVGLATRTVALFPGNLGPFWNTAGAALVVSQIWTNVFEEFGFRGYLTPQSAAVFTNRLGAHLFTGVIWGAWHIPYLPMITTRPEGLGVFFLVRFLTSAAIVSIVYGIIRLRTGSFWPAVLMQFTGGLAFGLLGAAAEPLAGAWFLSPSFDGGLMILLSGLAAGYMLSRGRFVS